MDYISATLLLVSVANIFYGTFVFNRNRDSVSARIFFGLAVVVSIWGASMFLLRDTADPALALLFTKVLYTSAALIPTFLVFFALQFPDSKGKLARDITLTVAAPMIFILWLVWQPNMLIADVLLRSESITGEPHVVFNILPHIFYILYIGLYFLLAHIFLFKTYYKRGEVISRQIVYITIGTISAVTISTFTNIILPFLGNFSLNWIGPTATTIAFFTISYSVYKHKAFNLHIQFSEILAVGLIGITVVDLVTSVTQINSMSFFIWRLAVAVLIALVAKSFLDGLFAEQKSKEKLKKLNKRLRDLDQKKNEFLHMASHQLRSPITAINGYVSLMYEGQFGKVTKEMEVPLQKVMSAGKIMNDTIVDYLNIARMEDGSMEHNPENFALCALAAERAGELRVTAEEKGLYLNVEPSVNAPCEVYADKKNIVQVLNAVVENAIKYTKEGGITVRAERDEYAGVGRVYVTDTGIGVPLDEIPHLFKKFSRAPNAKEADVFGTGMGLYIAKSLIEANGGTIKVASKGENKGSVFTIELPLAKGE